MKYDDDESVDEVDDEDQHRPPGIQHLAEEEEEAQELDSAALDIRNRMAGIREKMRAQLGQVHQKLSYKVNPHFRNYYDAFQNLTHSVRVKTAHPIVSMIITNDSTRAITVTKINDRLYNVT